MNRSDVSGTILTFALGLGIGAVAALLLAPKSGDDLRGDIADGVNDRIDQARTGVRSLKRRAQKVVDLAADHVQDALDAGDNAYNQARNS